ncbi:ATP-binding protein [Deinococcus hopiensis]|uniref:Tetratricopeptide repeat-containing protein n=1 Tax=Deinococcus hopiensis KR-140 TaxID=695939 RepID=A0A1W1UBY6_9DEIO|nr:AAA family ATPase [Deinococcus hopiensis]SMB78304.1 Tetratricopeptide repeat-containing protein [Deinococcus hopiensis KR-140]
MASSLASPVSLRLLGSPALEVEGRAVPLRTRKSLGLVAYLALEGASGRETLAGLLWPNLAPDSARHNLRQELYRLTRTALGPHVEVSARQVTPAGAWAVDVAAFERAVADGDVAGALTHYRGPLLGGAPLEDAGPFGEWLEARRTRLHERWQEAVQRHAGALEGAGKLRAALDAHLTLLASDGLQELHQREAIRLHGLLGERERAAARYAAFCTLLANELGLEPLPETQRVAEQARRGPGPASTRTASPAPSAPPAPEAQLTAPFSSPHPPTLHPPLVGRTNAWTELEHAEGQLAVLLGEPGLGKSRLALAFAASFGPPVVLRAQEVARGTPLYPVADALRAGLGDPRARARFEALDPVWRAEVSRLVPELGTPGGPLGEGRARFLEGLVHALLALAGPGGCIVFEDLHWMDASTLELLAHLTRRLHPGEPGAQERGLGEWGRSAAAPRLLATARSHELPGSPAETALAGLRRGGLLRSVPLTPLSEEEVRGMVRTLSGGEDAVLFARRLHRATGGNPLFVLETLRFLFETGELHADASGWRSPYDEATEDYSELPLPPEVREAVLRRLQDLSPAAQRLLDAASVLEGQFSLDDLAPAAALPEWEALDELEGLTRLSVLEVRDPGFAFAHDLVRRAVASRLSPERRRLLHRRFAGVLEAQGAAPGRIATHLDGAGLGAQAAPWHVRAAEEAARVFAFREALAHLEAALASGPPPGDALTWRLRRADLLRHLDDRTARTAELHLIDALVATPEGAAHAPEVHLRWAILHDDEGRYEEARTAAECVLASQAAPPETRAWAQTTLGMVLQRLGDPEGAERHLRSALALEGVSAERRAAAHNNLTYSALGRGDLAVARSHNAAGLALLPSSPTRTRAVMLNAGARITVLSGDLAGGTARLREALEVARHLGDVVLQKPFLTNLVQLYTQAGQLDDALSALHEGLDLVQATGDRRGEGDFGHRLAEVQLLRGRLGAAARAYEAAITQADAAGQRDQQAVRRLGLLRLRTLTGDLAAARELLAEVQGRFAEDLPGLLAVEEARLYGRTGQPDQALRTLLAAREAGHLNQPLHRDLARALLAGVQLALGARAAALEEALQDAASPALQASLLAVRLRAREVPEDAKTARDLLASGRLPPLDALALRHALSPALPDPEARALLTRLAATLPTEAQAAFLALWAAPGGPT